MDDQLTINDLPVECVDQILKCITDRVDKISARFVCKFWCALIDQDCSFESYQIDYKRIQFDQFFYDIIINGHVDFSKICSTFVNSQRRKSSFKFDHVDLKDSEQFWRAKGKDIIWLNFGSNCPNIPLMEIIENCSILKTLTIELNYDGIQTLNDFLKSCVTDGKRNFSVRSLYLHNQPWKNISEVVELVSQVFLGLQNVFFDKIKDTTGVQWADEWNSLSTNFEKLKLVITLSIDTEIITFDSSRKVPATITSSLIDCEQGLNNIDISRHLSRYSCDLSHLNSLKIISKLMTDNYKLDDVKELITRYPSLKSLTFSQSNDEFQPPTKPLSKNNIEDLTLDYEFLKEEHVPFSINDAFLRSYENLKSFECGKLVFTDFVKLLRKFPNLENLIFTDGTIDIEPVEETIANGKLLALQMPSSFLLQTMAKYDFKNLKSLELIDIPNENENENLAPLPSNFHEHAKRINCPILKILLLDFITEKWSKNQDQVAQWMAKILATFPTLTDLLFCSANTVPDDKNCFKLEITDQILKAILANHRKLRVIGHTRYPTSLYMLSPSNFKCRSKYGESELKQ